MLEDILFPPLEPYHHFFLKVSDVHTLYVEECGNPEGYPVIFLHGGPGGGLDKDYRRFFNPDKYRILLFDQRGCGQSTPHAELSENTTWDLVADIEKIRQKLKIDKWMVFGGSWGSTLALAYAVTHPEQVHSLILRGIFLIRRFEIEWFYQCGASRLFPDAFKAYRDFIPANEQGQLVRAYYHRLTSSEKSMRIAAAKKWSQWEAATSKLLPSKAFIDEFENEDRALAFARIEAHYFVNDGFFPSDEWLLQRVEEKLSTIPVSIVHGRYDVVCPVENAFELKARLPHAHLVVSPQSGHSAFEVENARALIEFTERHLN